MPELRSNWNLNLSKLAAEKRDENKPLISGYAAMYNNPEVIMGLFIERIAPQAFDKVLSERQDVVTLFNHNPDFPLGRTEAGTLRLRTDATGLFQETDVNPEDTDAMNVWRRVQRGEIRGQSFAFMVREASWKFNEDDLDEREILDISQLFDVGPVTYPAYKATSIAARSEAEQMHKQARAQFERARHDYGSKDEVRTMIVLESNLEQRSDLKITAKRDGYAVAEHRGVPCFLFPASLQMLIEEQSAARAAEKKLNVDNSGKDLISPEIARARCRIKEAELKILS